MNNEIKVGIFIIVGIFMLFGLSTQVGSFQFNQQKGYPINITLQDANGLEKNAKVKSRGITIGTVESFKLTSNNVIVNLRINEDIKIPKDSIVSIKQESMLGVKYIDIKFSKNQDMLLSGSKLTKSIKLASFDETSDTINKTAITLDNFVKRLDRLVAKNEKNITILIDQFKQTGEEFNKMGKSINKKLPSILTKFESVGAEFETTGKTINKSLPNIMTKFEKLEDDIDVVVTENRKNLKSAIKNIDSAFASVDKASVKVESSFDKLDKYLSSTTKSTLGVDIKSQRMSNDGYNKAYFGFDYSPKPTIHYLLDIVSTNDYRDDGTNTQTPKTTKLHEKGRTLISAQYGKDLGRFRVRGGIIENTGGLGVDYFSYNRRLKYSIEAYDYNAYNDVRGDTTHLTTQLEYTMRKHILLYTGYDNILNKDARTIYFGVGVKFEDDDLKYLIGSSASSIN